MSTPPQTAKSRSPDSMAKQALITESRDDEHAPSTVYAPPRKSKKLAILPAMMFDIPPGRESSLISGSIPTISFSN